ncbi:MAG: hypothetical protein IPM51_05415 [Sphingobacteriaceae bacterium]|nr:hypothetical protein [Sphingobacteriaceae bacterium]
MIAPYLYQVFLNTPNFSINSPDNSGVLQIINNELSKFKTTHQINSDNETVHFLTQADKSKIQNALLDFPFLEIFYAINSFQEYNCDKNAYDELGRFKFSDSLQKKYKPIQNRVFEKMKQIHQNHESFQKHFSFQNIKSSFYLSHDIDSIHGSFYQDGVWAIKHGRIDVLIKLIFHAFMQKPHWFNMDFIMKTEGAYGYVSTFYWLVNRGKVDQRQTNSDYDINDLKVEKIIQQIDQSAFHNGIHKSISTDSFETELKKMPIKVNDNRYHYLKFQLPHAYKAIQQAKLESDASLGYAEHYGFRNNYGYPFHPYDIENGKPYDFLEIPLHIMDGTFQRYLKIPVTETGNTIIDFLEKNSENALLSILWHNTFFTNYKYKGYLNEYKKVLDYLYQNKWNCQSLDQIKQEFRWKMK